MIPEPAGQGARNWSGGEGVSEVAGGRGGGDSQGQLHVLYGAAAAVLTFLAILPLDSCLVGEV